MRAGWRALLLGWALAAVPAIAGPVASYGQVSLPPGLTRIAASNPDKQMCVSDETTGSRLEGVRTCHTAAEWLEIKRRLPPPSTMVLQEQAACPSGNHCAQ